jgi:hypothetical protein
MDASFVEIIVRYLDEHPDVALCFSDSLDIKDGVIVRRRIHNDVRDNVDWTAARRKFFTYNHRIVLALYGIYRLSILHDDNIILQPGYKGITFGVERSMLPWVALQGRIVALPEPMRYTRIHNESLGVTEPRSLKSLYVLMNVLHNIIKYQVRVVHLSKLPVRQKLTIYGEIFSIYVGLYCTTTTVVLEYKFYSLTQLSDGGS